MQQPDTLSTETLARIRALAFEQVALMDELEGRFWPMTARALSNWRGGSSDWKRK